MSDKKNQKTVEELKKEASTVATSLKGFSAPFGAKMIKRKQKAGNNVSKPYGEPELFENMVIASTITGNDLAEVVKKVGKKWVVQNDKTGSTVGSYDNREAAWEKQRLLRKQQQRHHKTQYTKSHTDKPPVVHDKAKTASKSHKAAKSQTAPKARVNKETFLKNLKSAFASVLKEGSMISYVFEQAPQTEQSVMWEKFIEKLSKETVMSDPKLKNILKNVAKSEVKIMSAALDALASVLEGTGHFTVKRKGVDQDEAGDILLNFTVSMKEGKQSLPFSIKVENGRPLLLFPQESRNMLNQLNTEESKLLRAEAMHVQETVFDNMNDVVDATGKRDQYLDSLQVKVDKLLDNANPLEISMIKYLLKNKYNSVR